MSNFNYTNDADTVEMMSEQRDHIYDHVVKMFRVHMANDDIDSAMALADEFYEWMDPDQLDNEPTFFVSEHDIRRLYIELTAED